MKLCRTTLSVVINAVLAGVLVLGLLAGQPSVLAQTVSVAPGLITTYAGDGTKGSTGDNGPAVAAELNAPEALASDGAGNIYILDTGNYKVRKVTASTGIITTVVGTGVVCASSATPPSCGDGGPATSAQLNIARGIFVTASGVLYIADTNDNEIRMVNAAGIITTIAGNGTASASATIGNGGAATSAELNTPRGVYVDPNSGVIYIADSGDNVIRTVTNGTIAAYAGGATTVCTGSTDTLGDGCPALSSKMSTPASVWKDAAGNVYITDSAHEVIRKIKATTGIITLVAGIDNTSGYTKDGVAATASDLNGPQDVITDSAGDMIIADYANNRIRYVDGAGILSTMAGNGTAGSTGDNALAPQAEINAPHGVAIDPAGYVYEAGYSEQRIRRINTLTSLMSFGNVFAPNASAAQTVTLTASGTAPLSITGIVVPAGFTEIAATGGTDCQTLPTLQPLSSCLISMEFTPTFNGVQTGTVSVSTNATNEDLGTVQINMTGTGQYNSTVPTVTTLSVSPTTTYSGQPVMISATVTGAGGTPTTYVSFYSGSTLLGNGTLTNGTTSVLTTTALAVGTDPIKAVYNGDPTYNPSTSPVTNVTVYAGPPNFTITPATTTEATQAGLSVNVSVAVQAINGYSGSPAFTCLGLPTYMTCTFSPSTVTLAANAKYNVLLTIATTTTPPAINGRLRVAGGVTVCLLAPLLLVFLPGRRKRFAGLLCILSGMMLAVIQGCSGISSITTKVATGTYSVVVQGKDGNGLTNAATISVTVQ